MSAMFRAIVLSLLWMTACPSLAAQQEVDTESLDGVVTETEAARYINDRLAQLARDIGNLQILAVQIANAPSVDREALSYRRDTRSLELLKEIDEVAALVAELPEADPMRIELESRMLDDFQSLGDSVYDRIDELEKQIQETAVEIESKQGVDLVLADSIMNNLESTKDLFIRAMVEHIETVELLGLSPENTLPPLKLRLRLQAESAAGRLVFVSSIIQDLDQRLSKNKTDPDLLTVRNQAAEWGRRSLGRLRELVTLMTRLEMPQAEYRALIAQESEGLSVEMIQPDVISQVVSGRFGQARDYVVKQGPHFLLNMLVFIGILLVFRMLSGLFRKAVELTLRRSEWNISVLFKDVLVSTSGAAFMLVGLLFALTQVGISIGPMLAGLGLAGFIVGIALQDTLSNFASGAMILLYRPYDMDDFIELPGAAGIVTKMTLVATTITTFDNQTLVIPNRQIWGDVIKNLTAQRVRRVDLAFGISYSDDIEHAERILAAAAKAHELVLDSPATMIKVDSLGESAVNMVLRPWTKTPNYWTVYWDLTRDVKLRFDQAGIRFAFPQRDIHVYDEKGET